MTCKHMQSGGRGVHYQPIRFDFANALTLEGIPMVRFGFLLASLAFVMVGTIGAGPTLAQTAPTAIAEISRACIHGDCENGSGTLEIKTQFGTNTYVGNFKEAQYHGYGKLTELISFTQRAYYDGNWEMGVKNGRGTYWNGRGDLYMGQWRNDRRHGQGSYFFGIKDWSENKYSEFWLSENTENYVGDFVNDLYQGRGTYRWPDGQKYVGEFFANDKHGPGTFYYPRGTARQQVWEYGKFLY
jgi:hypothetical protein